MVCLEDFELMKEQKTNKYYSVSTYMAYSVS